MLDSVVMHQWVGHKIAPPVQRMLDRLVQATDVVRVAVMPDVHLAGDVCNGVVVATRNTIYPACVGGDIGCGYLSIELAVPDELKQRLLGRRSSGPAAERNRQLASTILHQLARSVPGNKHPVPQDLSLDAELSSPKLISAANREGRFQLGTLGRGNHFVELQRDDEQRIFLLIHSGSRAMGQLVSGYHQKLATWDSRSGLGYVTADSAAGLALQNDLSWARQYAAANRKAMLSAFLRSLAPLGVESISDSLFDKDHNHVQPEQHDGNTWWVHRKGAQGLAVDQTSVIPGSMGTTTIVVTGRGNCEALNSCSHGAGRQMSRTEAVGSLSVKELRRQTSRVWLPERNLKRLIDESPSAYKDIRQVMKAQKELVRIIGRRYPVLNYKN